MAKKQIAGESKEKKLKAEVHELCKFKCLAEKFLAEHGLKDYFRKAFIHSNNQEL